MNYNITFTLNLKWCAHLVHSPGWVPTVSNRIEMEGSEKEFRNPEHKRRASLTKLYKRHLSERVGGWKVASHTRS